LPRDVRSVRLPADEVEKMKKLRAENMKIKKRRQRAKIEAELPKLNCR